MKFKCINNADFPELLTVGKIYKGMWDEEHGEYMKDYIRIENCDDGVYGIFKVSRFEIIKEKNETLF